MRAIALYLPQYHYSPGNDAWWAEGDYLEADTETGIARLDVCREVLGS